MKSKLLNIFENQFAAVLAETDRQNDDTKEM